MGEWVVAEGVRVVGGWVGEGVVGEGVRVVGVGGFIRAQN